MSFSNDLKQSIKNYQYKNACCRKAFLQGVLATKAVINDSKLIVFNIDALDSAKFICAFIKELYAAEGEISSPPRGGRCKQVSFFSRAGSKFINGIEDTNKFYSEKCSFCKAAFFRGMYFASGRTSDPNKQFCLEFSLGNRIYQFYDFMNSEGFEMKISNRGQENILYSKNSTVIEDFFAAAELHDAAFTVMNVKIANELKNDANRIRNFDTVNISKAVEAASEQYGIIKKLYDNKLLSGLPEELYATARLRLENPDMSLSQLAIHSVPPVSKSGITHRMKKIMKLGEELLQKKDKR